MPSEPYDHYRARASENRERATAAAKEQNGHGPEAREERSAAFHGQLANRFEEMAMIAERAEARACREPLYTQEVLSTRIDGEARF